MEAGKVYVESYTAQNEVKVYLEKGQTAYPVVIGNVDKEMTFKFTIAQAAHEHELEFVEAKEPNYIESGNIAHYACICGKLYADADGKTERGRAMRQAICDKFNFASLGFQSLEGVVNAIGLEPCKLCTYCWTGKE